MTDNGATGSGPLWLSMEEKIVGLSSSDVEGNNRERTIQQLATELDEAGYNVSRHGGNMLQLRGAIAERAEVGRPLLTEFNNAVSSLTLDDLMNVRSAAVELIRNVGGAWPIIKDLDRRPHIMKILEGKRLDLLIAKAKDMAEDPGIRFLIAEQIQSETIISALGITEAKYGDVVAAIEAERAEIARVEHLLEEVADQSAEARARHLITNDVTDENIVDLAGIDKAAIDGAREAMAEELKEKQRLADEAAAAKKAAAEGPSPDAIPPDELLAHIEAIREIMEFSDQQDEIRQMCEQSNIPSSLVDVAVSDPDKFDELEKNAEG